MREKTSYVILSNNSTFLRGVITKHILQLNSDAGVYPARSLTGSYVLASEEANPSLKRFVISYSPRGEGFTVLDLDNDPLPILYSLLGVVSVEYKAFVRGKVYTKGRDLNTVYYYMVLLLDCVRVDGSLNEGKASLLMSSHSFKGRVSALECYRSLNNYVNNPSEESLFSIISVFSGIDNGRRFQTLLNCMRSILEDTVPPYIKSKLVFSKNDGVTLAYLNLAIEVALFDNFDVFISSLISKLP